MDMKRALDKGKLEYVKVQQGFSNAGDLVPAEVVKFDIAGVQINL